VPVEEIQANNYDLSISRYKEIEYEEVDYEPPEVIIDKIQALESQIQQNLEVLKEMLKETEK
jgi:type I restriction enzyme M protein